MCGIVGLFLTDPTLEPELGRLTAGMLAVMTDRGPDSAGFALYGDGAAGTAKLTLHGPGTADFHAIAAAVGEALNTPTSLVVRDDHAVLRLPSEFNVDSRRGLVGELRVLLGPNAVQG